MPVMSAIFCIEKFLLEIGWKTKRCERRLSDARSPMKMRGSSARLAPDDIVQSVGQSIARFPTDGPRQRRRIADQGRRASGLETDLAPRTHSLGELLRERGHEHAFAAAQVEDTSGCNVRHRESSER